MVSNNSKRTVRRALVAGAIALGAVTVSAGPAMAEPINIPGVGTFDLPAGVTVPPEIANIVPPAPEAAPAPQAGSFTAPFSSVGQRAADAAQSKIGAPYVYGAAGPSAYDCSGLTMMAWAQAGVSLPHSSSAQYSSGPHISESQLMPGDLVFYYSPISHVGMYIGNGMIVHAANPGSGVLVSDLHSMPYVGAVRPG